MIKNVKLLKVVRKKTKLKNTSVKTKKTPSKILIATKELIFNN